MLVLENPGIDPGTSRMRSGCSTIWANSPEAYLPLETCEWSYCDWVDLEIYTDDPYYGN